MTLLGRRALQVTQRSLTRINTKISHILTGDSPDLRTPYVAGLGEAYARGFTGCPCVFALSTGRVGTKTLTALLALSPRVVSVHEPEPRLVKASFDAYLEGSKADGEKWRAVVLAARDDLVCEANRKGRVYVETNNRLTYLAGALAAAFPASRFIHLHRHPYEVVRSAMRRGYYQQHNWDFARIRPRPDDPLARDWAGLPPLHKCAWYWAQSNADALAWLETLPPERRLVVRADALFAGDQATLERIFGFVGVEMPPVAWIEGVLGQRINAQRAGHFPAPSEWSEAERRTVREQVADVAARLGYSL